MGPWSYRVSLRRRYPCKKCVSEFGDTIVMPTSTVQTLRATRIIEVKNSRLLPEVISRTPSPDPSWRADSHSFYYTRLQKLPRGSSNECDLRKPLKVCSSLERPLRVRAFSFFSYFASRGHFGLRLGRAASPLRTALVACALEST